MVKPEVVSDDRMPLIARDIVKKIESELEYPGQIKVNIIRESRSVDYANKNENLCRAVIGRAEVFLCRHCRGIAGTVRSAAGASRFLANAK